MAGAGDDGPRIVFLGAPGSGKGTQAALLAEHLGVPAISTGEMLRDAVAQGSLLGERVREVMARGELVADDLMAEVVEERLARGDARRGFLLDGYPRTAKQAETLAAILERSSKRLDHVISIEVPEEKLIERALLRQRADDTGEVIRARLRVYREKTAPLIDHYRKQRLLRTVDGERSVSEVQSEIFRILE